MGRNSVALFPKLIANKLGLADPDKYTGASFRRTGATLLANNGESLIRIKKWGRWSSDTVAQRYVAKSSTAKLSVANNMLPGDQQVPILSPPVETLLMPPDQALLMPPVQAMLTVVPNLPVPPDMDDTKKVCFMNCTNLTINFCKL